jgi:hypothetical protein
MFDPKTKYTERLTDAVDLLMDFATLGEYGLEPAGRTRQGCGDLSAAPHPRRHTRTIHRTTQCNLLQEAGFRSPRLDLTR